MSTATAQPDRWRPAGNEITLAVAVLLALAAVAAFSLWGMPPPSATTTTPRTGTTTVTPSTPPAERDGGGEGDR